MSRTRRGRGPFVDHPARFVVAAFVGAIGVGTLLLLLPWSTAPGQRTDALTALFTATTTVCVTGLTVVDTGTHWTGFGQAVLVVLVQLGGLGFMTLASLLAMVVSRRLGLRMKLAATAERATLALGDVRRVLTGVAVVTITVELVTATVLALRLWTGHGYSAGRAAWNGVFLAVMAFNNAGLALRPDSLNGFATDVAITLPIMVSIVIGGLGFPVLVDLHQQRRRGRRRAWRRLSLHSRLTLTGTAVLLVVGLVAICASEWDNPGTFGGHGTLGKLWLGMFGSITPRTAGFHTFTPGAMTDEGLLATMGLMLVGAGSAGTSGGLKVGTVALLALVVRAELRGDREVEVFGRRIPEAVQRQAVTVAILGVGVVVAATTALLAVTTFPLRDAAFEAVSAFGTAGLTTGVTPTLPGSGRLVLVLVMLIGRLGPLTLGAALVLRTRTVRVRHPEEVPLIG